MCDWSQGRIVAVTMEPANGTYKAQSEIFLEGRPLNCSDIAVGPDGWLYISVGGRNTEGGIYRIVYGGRIPPAPKRPASFRRFASRSSTVRGAATASPTSRANWAIVGPPT